jgi:hypothetical protein
MTALLLGPDFLLFTNFISLVKINRTSPFSPSAVNREPETVCFHRMVMPDRGRKSKFSESVILLGFKNNDSLEVTFEIVQNDGVFPLQAFFRSEKLVRSAPI